MDVIHLPIELWTLIFDLLDIKIQVRLIQLCKIIKDKIFITDLCNIDYKFKIKINGDIIKKYPYIKRLDARWYSAIKDQDLVGLNLIELYASFNPKIKKINHMTNLRKLNASSTSCGIGDDDLMGLNLVELNAYNNPKIKKINYMTNLRILHASWSCGIGDDDLVGLNLVELYASDNPKIKKINHMTNLRILYASYNCGIGDDDLIGLNLVELHANDNPKIKNKILDKKLP